MFDRIAGRYDLLNHLLSGNRDKRWRRLVADALPMRADLRVLDLATGTGDQLLALYDSERVGSGIGIDLAEQMLEIGRKKILERALNEHLELQSGDAGEIPFDDESFDAVTISFGIRNVLDVSQTLKHMHRVLRPEGRAIILEFSLPKSKLLKSGYLFYLRHILPHLGAAISGDGSAYRYLNQTIETFPYGEKFCGLMRDAGFAHVGCTPLTLGVASIYVGDK